MLTPRPGRADPRTQALLGGLCFFLSAIEYLIPKPLPFMRLGLANLPLLLALDILGPADYFLLALLKTAGQGIISGSLFSYVFLFSLAGTFSSAALMFGIRRLMGKHAGFAGIGCAGAMLSNGVQLLLARCFVFGAGLRFLAPPFLASGFISGAALGLFCEAFCRRSRWYAKHSGNVLGRADAGGDQIIVVSAAEKAAPAPPPPSPRRQAAEIRRISRRRQWDGLFSGGGLFAAFLLMALLFLANRSTPSRILQFVFFCFLAWLSGKKIKPFTSALIMAGIVFCNLLAPYGKILAAWGPLRITEGSLWGGLGKALTLEGLVMLSAACVKAAPNLSGGLTGPGAPLAESFRMLELMRERRGLIRRGRVIEGIDSLMLELDAAPDVPAAPTEAGGPRKKHSRNVKGFLLLAGMAALTAAIGTLPLTAIGVPPLRFILSP
ncbi:MAG: Gx transporter family protein [Treponema sp.]|jgi:heptaprenyl diphosphate synthase|nr:Gx transporter family protein [Treponema sp.]